MWPWIIIASVFALLLGQELLIAFLDRATNERERKEREAAQEICEQARLDSFN